MERQEFEWMLSSCRNLQRTTSLQGKFYFQRDEKTENFVEWQEFHCKKTIAGCNWIHQVRNKTKNHTQLIFMCGIEGYIDLLKKFIYLTKYLRTRYSKNIWYVERSR